MQTVVPKDLFASWQHALAHWTFQTSHENVLGVAAKHQQLAWLAARYREAARSNPQDPIARDRLQGVQRAAALLAFSAVRRDTRPKKMHPGLTLLFAFVVCTGVGLLLTDMMRQQQHLVAR